MQLICLCIGSYVNNEIVSEFTHRVMNHLPWADTYNYVMIFQKVVGPQVLLYHISWELEI